MASMGHFEKNWWEKIMLLLKWKFDTGMWKWISAIRMLESSFRHTDVFLGLLFSERLQWVQGIQQMPLKKEQTMSCYADFRADFIFGWDGIRELDLLSYLKQPKPDKIREVTATKAAESCHREQWSLRSKEQTQGDFPWPRLRARGSLYVLVQEGVTGRSTAPSLSWAPRETVADGALREGRNLQSQRALTSESVTGSSSVPKCGTPLRMGKE